MVGAGVEVPVEELQVVPGHVFPVVGEFHGESVERALVQAADETFHHPPRQQGCQAEPGQGPRVQVTVGVPVLQDRRLDLRTAVGTPSASESFKPWSPAGHIIPRGVRGLP